MSAPFRLSVASFLDSAIEHVKLDMEPTLPVGERLRSLWAGVVAARDLAATDVIEDEFLALAFASGLARDLGQHAADSIRHIIRWGLLGQNPFQ
jgi:hypothetical protein